MLFKKSTNNETRKFDLRAGAGHDEGRQFQVVRAALEQRERIGGIFWGTVHPIGPTFP